MVRCKKKINKIGVKINKASNRRNHTHQSFAEGERADGDPGYQFESRAHPIVVVSRARVVRRVRRHRLGVDRDRGRGAERGGQTGADLLDDHVGVDVDHPNTLAAFGCCGARPKSGSGVDDVEKFAVRVMATPSGL